MNLSEEDKNITPQM